MHFVMKTARRIFIAGFTPAVTVGVTSRVTDRLMRAIEAADRRP
jgi:hypothetical protein